MSLEACRSLVERGDSDRYAAIRGYPEEVQARLLPILAFNLEVSRAPWVTKEHLIAEMRLQWWRDVLTEIETGAAVRRHEVTTPLAAAIDPKIAALLGEIVEARRWDIYDEAFENAARCSEYLQQTGGNLMQAMAASLGSETVGLVRAFGTASAAANFLRAIPDLKQHGKRPSLESDGDGVELRNEATSVLKGVARKRAQIDPMAIPALMTGWTARPVLKAHAQGGFDQVRALESQSEFSRRGRLLKLSIFGWWR